MGFGESDESKEFERLEQEILAALRQTFSPEFINRVDEVIVFNPLGESDLRSIVDILLDDVNVTLAERRLRVEISDDVRDWLLEKAGIDPSTGARPLRRTIQRHIQDSISEILITQPAAPLELIRVTVEDGNLSFESFARESEVPALDTEASKATVKES